MSFRPLSKSIISLSKPVFQRKYIKLGRIYSYWTQIIGEEYAEKAMPIALKTRPIKLKKGHKEYRIETTLCIITNSASALPLSYQKERILGRIETLFGERLVNDLKITQNHSLQKISSAQNPEKISYANVNEIENMMKQITDHDLRETLEHFSQSLYQSVKHKEETSHHES